MVDSDARVEDPRPRRIWRHRAGVALLIVVAATAIGLQVRVSSERSEAARQEQIQRTAERDEVAARTRLDTVSARAVIARAEEAEALARLDGSREAMTAQGLAEGGLDETQRADARHVKDLRSQNRTIQRLIAEQIRLQPAAGTCIFDLLQALSRVGHGHTGGPLSGACATVAGHTPGSG